MRVLIRPGQPRAASIYRCRCGGQLVFSIKTDIDGGHHDVFRCADCGEVKTVKQVRP